HSCPAGTRPSAPHQHPVPPHPRISTPPAPADTTPPRMDNSVVFPLPEGPARNRHSPHGTDRSIPRSTRRGTPPARYALRRPTALTTTSAIPAPKLSLQHHRGIDTPHARVRQERSRQANHEYQNERSSHQHQRNFDRRQGRRP